ncbi:uncharacterized protein [Oscarella lobularis]|uniref:uncharacterized protein isoform X2 n=1 Tax=Oscarella lobularis TaxID=121494 RepID=UPI00331396F3
MPHFLATLLLLPLTPACGRRSFRVRAIMGFFGAYFGVLMCLHWLVAGQQRYSRCVDHYKTGSRIDRHYDLEILARIVVSVYCKDMNTGEPSEYISLTSSRERNYASYYKLLGSPSACPPTVPQQNWDEWGKTHFTRIRFDFDSWLVTTNDFSFATSVEGGSNIPYGQGGDNQATQTCPFRGDFNIDLTSTPFEVDPQVTWSWEGPMSNNHSVSFSNLRQIVSGQCGGFPGICFPVLPSNRSIARLKLRLVSTHPCLTKNPCENLGKCFVRDAKAYDCSCLPGSRGSNCEEFLETNRFNFCAQERGLVCQNSGTCENIIKKTIPTYGGDGGHENCQFPSTWLGKPVTQCVSNCSVGPPFACFVHLDGVSAVALGWWSPGIVYTLEGWFRPTAHAAGRKTIMGTFQGCSKMGVALDNGKFALVYKPLAGCSNSSRTGTIGYINQWHHVAVTVDGTNARLYVNGSLLKTVQTRTAFLFPPLGFRLGKGYDSSNNGFAGDIKSFTVWKRILERAEIVDHYNDPLEDFNTTHHVIYNRLAAHHDFCTNSQPECRGIDWGYKDWSPADGDVVFGVHCNVRTFAIEADVTVKVAPWTFNNSTNLGANGTFQVFAHDIIIRGTLCATGAGFMGGDKPTKSNTSGEQGESFLRPGTKTSAPNEGGGGGGQRDGKPGGGGGYGTAGQPGGGEGGLSYGSYNLRILHLGSGGGSGSNSVSGNLGSDGRDASAGALYGGKGGNGGGALRLDALNRIQVTGQVSANGSDGEDGYLDRKLQESGGGGGGGAGGSIYLRGSDINVNDGRIMALGGRGGCGALRRCGGDGGLGRIRIDSDKFTGKTEPSPAFERQYLKTFNDLATLARESISISQMNSSNDQSVYLGCINDKRQLRNRVPMTDEESEIMTPEFCRQKCYAKNYKYYFVHSANQCFCDNEYEEVVLDDSNCNLPCPGNLSLTCGGSQGISTYGPIPWRPAESTASRTCKPWCPVGFSLNSNQPLYGFCSNTTAFSWDFHCNCPAGVHGKLCEVSCFKGKYGPNCEKDCECQNDTGCDSVSGACNKWTGPTSSLDSSVPQVTVIVSIITSVLVLIIFGATATCIRRRRKRRLATAAFDSVQLRDNWEISRGDIFLLEKIGQGAFGVVVKAHLYHKSSSRLSIRDLEEENKSTVACKMLKGSCQNDSEFMEEIELMKRIGKHPHIVSMLGCITKSQPLCLIVEYCCHGDLLSSLKKGRLGDVKGQQKSDKKSSSNESKEVAEHTLSDEIDVQNAVGMFTASDLLSFSWQIASGMNFN